MTTRSDECSTWPTRRRTSYLETLAEKSGGRLLRADTIGSLPDAFAKIAAELRTQYLLGYYPLNKERDERYRKIKVTATRKDVMIRARPGYIATAAQMSFVTDFDPVNEVGGA